MSRENVNADVRVYRAIENLRAIRNGLQGNAYPEDMSAVQSLSEALVDSLGEILKALEGLHDDMSAVGRS